ncbi:MAG: AraC family transcriptional regulator [Bacteroidales bacterium]|nr:AraC family transcriptional regulator [Bacteroidales bacterium]
MRKKPFISLHRCICAVSGLCLLLLPLFSILREGSVPDPACAAAAVLAAAAILLLLPIGEEQRSLSLYFLIALSAACLGGSLAGLPERVWLLAVLLLHAVYLLCRIIERYRELWPLFKQFSIWYGIMNHARFSYSLLLYLLVAGMPDGAAPRWTRWTLLALALALFAALAVRARTGRTLFLPASRESDIKAMIKGSLRPAPVQAAHTTEEVARMTRLYERAVALMEKKRPFLDDGFGLDDMAVALFTNRAYLSKSINILSGRNFRQFVNYYRIQYCVEILRQDPNLKLINVAMMSGFHTTASFNMAFKLNLGETPTQFQERVRSSKLKPQG